jgi:hypothetical protein
MQGSRKADHEETLSLVREVGFDMAFMFAYRCDRRTFSWQHAGQDTRVPPVPGRRTPGICTCSMLTLKEEKQRRLEELINLHHHIAAARNAQRFAYSCSPFSPCRVGTVAEVMIDGVRQETSTSFSSNSRKDGTKLVGRTSGNQKVNFPIEQVIFLGNWDLLQLRYILDGSFSHPEPGDIVSVSILFAKK